MSAVFLVTRGPTRAANTRALLDEVMARSRTEPASVLWIAPSRHALPAVEGVRALSINDLVEMILQGAGVRTLSAGQRRLIVEEILAEGRLRHFAGVGETAGFAERLLGWIDERRASGVDAASVERGALGLKEREAASLYRRYEEALLQFGEIDAPGREFLAAERLPQSSTLGEVRTIVVDGFSEFTPGQAALLMALRRRVEEFHIALCDDGGEERAELWSGPRRTLAWLIEHGATVRERPGEVATPPGLNHLSIQLFRPLRKVEPSPNASGLSLVRAPGMVGEARMIARRVKLHLLDGVAPDAIDVVVRDISTYADLLQDIFTEYGIPVELDARPSLLRNPAVSLLTRALRLADDDFPFSAVTALLRHTCFRPPWADRDDRPQLSEALLRLLAVPRGREAYLAAVERWAERAQQGLEDETVEESRRQRTHELAKECRPFLARFFRAWDDAPARGALGEHIAWLRGFLDEMGLARDTADISTWDCLWSEIGAWQRRTGKGILDRRTFTRRLTTLASRTQLPTARPEGPRVLVLDSEQARHRHTDHRFLLGLGERAFPRPSADSSLLGDAEAGEDNLASEMLLFHDVVTGARRSLGLSYPAVDDRGQELLPGSFLQAVESCFAPGVIEVEQRQMLIEGYLTDRPLSPSEHRAQAGATWPVGAEQLDADVRANLYDAAAMARARFHDHDFTPYDGLIRDPFLAGWVGRLFGPQRVFSPTALEDYIACPFRFFLRHVLRLEPLEDPREEIEVTRRGMAFHRALARLHTRLRDQGQHHPADGIAEEVQREMRIVIDEDIQRAPGLASKELWRLEGQRLLKSASRYPAHWAGFLKPWQERGVAPRPHLFEVDFGMPTPEGAMPIQPLILRHDEVEVRLWGRIDRVDLAELDGGVGFWIIDYKTGRSSHYTGTDLAEFRKLQLTLYAAAVEAVLLHGRRARPLGLAYWLVSESGPKVVLPGRNAVAWLEEASRWPAIRERLTEWVASLASNIRRGAFPLAPRSEHCTQTCPYGQVCRISQARSVGKTWGLPLPGEEGRG